MSAENVGLVKLIWSGEHWISSLRPKKSENNGNKRFGVFGAACEVTEKRSGKIVYDFSFQGISTKELSRREALKSATERSVESFIKEMFRKQ